MGEAHWRAPDTRLDLEQQEATCSIPSRQPLPGLTCSPLVYTSLGRTSQTAVPSKPFTGSPKLSNAYALGFLACLSPLTSNCNNSAATSFCPSFCGSDLNTTCCVETFLMHLNFPAEADSITPLSVLFVFAGNEGTWAVSLLLKCSI